MRIVSTLLFSLFAFGGSITSFAATGTIGDRGERIPVLPVATQLSQAGESKDAFVMRMGMWFRNFTTTSGYEACGYLAQSSTGQYGVVINTSNSQLGCGLVGTVPPGFTRLDETIHSHPVVKRLDINANDRAFLQARQASFKPVPQRMRTNVDPRVFSKEDYASGPGYLVTDERVLYQRGAGTAQEVGILPPAPPQTAK